MLQSGSHGLACWYPPPRGLSRPVNAGDVGTFSARDGFRFIFNIWEDEELIRSMGEGTSYDEAYCSPGERNAHIESYTLVEGQWVAQGLSVKVNSESGLKYV